jgi:hypothetical protein
VATEVKLHSTTKRRAMAGAFVKVHKNRALAAKGAALPYIGDKKQPTRSNMRAAPTELYQELWSFSKMRVPSCRAR